ncbi:MAG: hypothetical protein GY722_23990 [bacterium]|nr:hypothetical protein [bacterium]
MARSWQLRRIFPLFAFAALLGSSGTYAQPDAERSGPLQDEVPALEIIDKRYDEGTGILRVVLRNRSDLAVTAFGLSSVDASPTGSGVWGTDAQDLYILGGIAPGASYEMEISLGDPIEDSSSRFAARSVKLDHEIRSDNTSYGNTKDIDMWFEQRAADFVECEAALARLREATSGLPKSVRPLLKAEREDGQAAQSILLDSKNGRDQRERARLSAIVRLAEITKQVEKWIETGSRSEQEAVAFLQQFFEERLAIIAKNIRPADLERYER